MYRAFLSVAAVVTGASVASADTLNFANESSTRVNQTVAEDNGDNEKNIDFGDFDNDGDLDVVIAVALSDFGQRRNKLYQNDGGVFNEVSGSPVISGFTPTDVTRIPFMRDFNDDGWLDIYIINDSNAGPGPGTDKIYINQHPGDVFSHFNDESAARLVFGSMTGCTGIGCTGAACNGVSWDFDEDGYVDIYCANYPNSSQDRMYTNLGFGNEGFFIETTGANVPGDGDYTVDVNSADINGDGKVDLLIANDFDQAKIYYNNNEGVGSGDGDFNYGGAGNIQLLGLAGAGENAIVGADFDGDGDTDLYWTNYIGSTGDRFRRNDGNDVDNQATFTTLSSLPSRPPASVIGMASRKVTIADFNNDGRPDLFVGKEKSGNSRPTVLRNISVGGVIAFVDWSPGNVFTSGSTHKGWHGAVFDTNGDGDLDIFFGAFTDDYIFEQVPSVTYLEGDLGPGQLIPDVYNRSAQAVIGSVGVGTSDQFEIDGMTAGGYAAVILNGPDDYLLELLDGRTVLATLDRGGLGVEEAIHYDPGTLPASITIRVTGLECASPSNLVGDCGISTEDLLELLGNWGDPYSTGDLLDLLGDWGPSQYTLEILARDG